MAKVRTTISIDEELVARFKRAADRNRVSLSAEINAWLLQVVEPAEFVSELAERSKAKGVGYVREMISAMKVLQEDAAAAVDQARAGGRAELAIRGRQLVPPSSNTGGKVPTRTKGRRS